MVEGDEHPVSEVSLTYDAAGNPVSIVDAPVVGVGDAQCFAYDGLRVRRVSNGGARGMDDGGEGMEKVMRVGVTFPGRLTVNWPLVRIRVSERGLGIGAPLLLRRIITKALYRELDLDDVPAAGPFVPWTSVSYFRRVSRGVEFGLAGGGMMLVFSLIPRRLTMLAGAAEAQGVRDRR